MTAKLILTLDGAIIKEYPINQESISIGRSHGNDIQINDKTVSGRHALINTFGGETFAEDLGSTNGTLVDGKHISKILLMHGDIIQTGTHQLVYFSEEKAEYEPTMFIKAELSETQTINTGELPEDPAKGLPLAGAKILNGPSANTVMEMRKPFNTIGYKGISLAVIARGNTRYTISALKNIKSKRSSDAPLINGKPIGSLAQELKEHDIIEIAGFQMEFVNI
ncbi:MAG: FHA domain-containing protein [Gammaproteobacteria bacterium]|nr:FHA domain-containing protein [Gammaproteobacteria bacterium]MCK5092937.1 FHA domain-containing protein [Gammaproteobacteria bacterium]